VADEWYLRLLLLLGHFYANVEKNLSAQHCYESVLAVPAASKDQERTGELPPEHG
jgi:hypothetical protein